MSLETYVDGPYRTFTEETPGQLSGKEGYLVELTSNSKAQLLTTGVPVGVVHQKLQGSNDVTVRLLGKGGTVKMLQAGAITVGARLRAKASSGKVEAGTAGLAIGIKISPTGNGADGDFCEVLDLPGVIPQTLALGNTDSEIGALTISGSYSQAEVTALRDKCEELADDVRALKTKLDAAGITA